MLAVLALLAGACGDDSGDDSASDETTATGDTASDASVPPDGPTITIGTQDFGESAILSQIYGQALINAGYSVEYQELGGFRDLEVPAFESGDINFAPEYVASMLEFLNEFAGEATADVDATKALLDEQLTEIGLQALEPSPAQNRNTFVVTPETSEQLGLTSISDLTEDLTLGAPQDCEENAFCLPGLQDVYGIDLSGGFTPLDPGVLPDALDNGEIDVAVMFSTDGVIGENGYIQLEDDQELFNAENIVPVVTDEVVDAYGADFESLVNEVSAALTTELLTAANARFQIDAEDADVIAADFLADNGLG
ncbi:MAG TPA: ABC transporter substrate-binding protein [Acidimicrobiales bacterium]|nr:ABC transporter substrate-binding protein [Acidimicrobiales bacterium]